MIWLWKDKYIAGMYCVRNSREMLLLCNVGWYLEYYRDIGFWSHLYKDDRLQACIDIEKNTRNGKLQYERPKKPLHISLVMQMQREIWSNWKGEGLLRQRIVLTEIQMDVNHLGICYSWNLLSWPVSDLIWSRGWVISSEVQMKFIFIRENMQSWFRLRTCLTCLPHCSLTLSEGGMPGETAQPTES